MTQMAPLEKKSLETVTVHVTFDDIQEAAQHIGDNPITRAMRRELGQTWVVFGGTTAYLRSRPQQSISLPHAVFTSWEMHRTTGVWTPFSFEIDLETNVENIDTRIGRNRQGADRRQRDRRESPRFGFDRRSRERRVADRRVGPRRGEGRRGEGRRGEGALNFHSRSADRLDRRS